MDVIYGSDISHFSDTDAFKQFLTDQNGSVKHETVELQLNQLYLFC